MRSTSRLTRAELLALGTAALVAPAVPALAAEMISKTV